MRQSDSDFYSALGTRIKNLRVAGGVSAADMASVCKMGVGQYSNAESHGAGLTFDRLHSIGRTLGTTVDFVTAGLTD
ncbi:MAG: helix-turn-helix transcriptional regulator [Rhodospirillaceae bacterium]|jgi:transcriptional regulator with XRE-family HTH domain|nr:helix-turn-helix transcriptional regulator [Rhodospirillaceae bacterium]MBT5239057.1 helix-turn-helix transcriptional regulator [Rhodospirillaceae bacterium]MBT5565362.1 helix-turn-helix transcriptional regulator [Rhodospirillaceae bacterium]MBT6089101.1 helix-turn-helix transcriptional regulator [Rhodospirillaceae bacterium]MBT6960175.1 helix-turn-helix transcriptional regulator [Rhodospirillaceae bacterium]